MPPTAGSTGTCEHSDKMKDESGVQRFELFELNETEKNLVLAALQRMLARKRYRRVDGAKHVDFLSLVAKFSHRDLVRVSRKYVLIEREAPKSRPPEQW